MLSSCRFYRHFCYTMPRSAVLRGEAGGIVLLKKTIIFFSILIMLLLSLPVSAQNATRYITENFEADVRSGKTIQHRIVRMARSGEPVRLLREEDGYSLIRFTNGTEGWILSRFLQEQPHSRELLAQVQAELDEIRSMADDQPGQIAQLLDIRKSLESEVEQLNSKNIELENRLQEVLDVANQPLQIHAQNTQLRESLLEARNAADEYRRQLEVLRADSKRMWFLSGALVSIGSLLLGLLLAKLKKRRRSNEW